MQLGALIVCCFISKCSLVLDEGFAVLWYVIYTDVHKKLTVLSLWVHRSENNLLAKRYNVISS